MNFSVGIIGHVDSGKTAISKALSTFQSTAGFDKHPESQRRGITLDVGFSKFDFEDQQFTIVDCPGHAAFIKSVLIGVQIVDFLLLVVDGEKMLQQQTYESLVLMELVQKPSIIVLNKCDLLSQEQITANIKILEQTMGSTKVKQFKVISGSATTGHVELVTQTLVEYAKIHQKDITMHRLLAQQKPFLAQYDHHFDLKGQGIVFTGTVLQGSVKPGDLVLVGGEQTTVKSLQVFQQPVDAACVGERIGVLVRSFDTEVGERGLISTDGVCMSVQTVLCSFRLVKHYKQGLKQGQVMAVNFGHCTGSAKVYIFEKTLQELIQNAEIVVKKAAATHKEEQCAVLIFEQPLLIIPSQKFIGLKLDQQNSKQCRISFSGTVINILKEEDLLKFKEVMQREVKLEVVRIKDGQLVFKVQNDFDITGFPVYVGEKQIGQVLGRFGQDKWKAVVEMEGEYFIRLQNLKIYQW